MFSLSNEKSIQALKIFHETGRERVEKGCSENFCLLLNFVVLRFSQTLESESERVRRVLTTLKKEAIVASSGIERGRE